MPGFKVRARAPGLTSNARQRIAYPGLVLFDLCLDHAVPKVVNVHQLPLAERVQDRDLLAVPCPTAQRPR